MASEYVDDAEDIAARTMYELLGRRWVYPFVTTTETIHTVPGQTALIMNGRPIQSVASVRRSGTETDLPYVIENKYRIRLEHPLVAQSVGLSALNFSTLHGCNIPSSVDVVYTYGSRPPVEVSYAIEALTAELVKAMNEDDSCRLPLTVTSVTRQGVSMSLGSADFLKDGMTGVEEVDAMLAKFNPAKAKRPARVFGRMSPPPIRRNTTQQN